ncbi:MAG: hypothetical protein IMF19_13410 [Proteobacteria bacterium]|nr:hypothetical protein [Pseudomonadota bacterium]
MRNFWIVPGAEKNWRQAFISKGIWGLEETKHKKVYWLALTPNDLILFYVSGKVKGVVGYGIARNKFYQDIPLWEAEIRAGCIKWPLRFEFDVEFIIPENRWVDEKVSVPGDGEFRQPLILKEWDEIESIIQTLNPNASTEALREETLLLPLEEEKEVSPTHADIQSLLVEIGRLQGYIANPEFSMGSERLDVVWRRLPESVPTYVFEVQVGGDLYHALGKLKHAYDIWNSRIFLVASAENLEAVNHLISGVFHEIQPVMKFIETEQIQSLHKSKWNIHQIEKDLGLIP